MHITDAPTTFSPNVMIYECHHEGRLIGHIRECKDGYKARSWPDEHLLGTFANLSLASKAVVAASFDGDPEFWDNKLTIEPCQAVTDRSLLFERLIELINARREGEIIASVIFLQERGFSDDDVIAISEMASRLYDEEGVTQGQM